MFASCDANTLDSRRGVSSVNPTCTAAIQASDDDFPINRHFSRTPAFLGRGQLGRGPDGTGPVITTSTTGPNISRSILILNGIKSPQDEPRPVSHWTRRAGWRIMCLCLEMVGVFEMNTWCATWCVPAQRHCVATKDSARNSPDRFCGKALAAESKCETFRQQN